MSDIYHLTKLLEEEDILSVLDTLHLDEYVVDEGIDKIISKSNISRRQLNTLLVFIKYKLMLCLQEDEDCENDIIVEYVLQQLLQVPESANENFETLLKLFSHSLLLNKKQLLKHVDHITQQLISEVLSICQNISSDEDVSKAIVYLTIFDSLIITCSHNGFNINLRFLKLEFENLIYIQDKRISIHVFNKTVPNVIKCCKDVTFLNIIWKKVIKNIDQLCVDDVSIVCVLSNYYFPFQSSVDNMYNVKSFIIKNIDFWKLILFGIADSDPLLRKYCLYLGKRGIDFAIENNIDIHLKFENEDLDFFSYQIEKKSVFENCWKTFFVIMESLEEKQSHIVSAALDLLPKLDILHPSWLNCVLKRGLVHDNDSIIRKTLEIALKVTYYASFPYEQLIEALNKLFIYEDFFCFEKNKLFFLLKDFLRQKENMENILGCATIKALSPIPLFCFTYILTSTEEKHLFGHDNLKIYIDRILDHKSSNILLIEDAIHYNMFKFYINQISQLPEITNLCNLFSKFSDKTFSRDSDVYEKLILLVQDLFKNIYSDKTNAIIDILNTALLSNVKNISSFTILLLDASVISPEDLMNLIKSQLELLKECDKRLYASNEEFDFAYKMVINLFVQVQFCEDNSKKDIKKFEKNNIYNVFVECLRKHCDSIVSYLMKRLQNTIDIIEFDHVNVCVYGLQNLLLCKKINNFLYASIQCVIEKCIKILNTSDIEIIQKYFAAEILFKVALFIESNDFFENNDKKTIFTNYFDAIKNALLCVASESKEINQSKGKVMSAFNQVCCELYYLHYKYTDVWTDDSVMDLTKTAIEFLEKGGSKCIGLIIKLSSVVIQNLMKKNMWIDIEVLLEKIWREILDVRKNEQFKKSIRDFVKLMFSKSVFTFEKMHQFLLVFGNRLFELGDVAPYTVYHMMNEISIELNQYDLSPLISLVVNALLFGNVPRKDQRIESDVCGFIVSHFSSVDSKDYIMNPTEKIKVCTLKILINQSEDFHKLMIAELQNKTLLILKPKQRYHGNSMNHRILLRIMQALLLSWKSTLSNPTTLDVAKWCAKMLCSQPHHASIRIMAEWYISLHLIHEKKPLRFSSKDFDLSNLPQISYFMILYHVVKHQIIRLQNKLSYSINITSNTDYNNSVEDDVVWENLDFVIEIYMPHMMGQLFNIRLNAQYLTHKLYELVETFDKKSKYSIIQDCILNNFKMNSEEKNLKKIKEEFYVNNLDVIFHLNVNNIYNQIPRLIGITHDELISLKNSNRLDNVKSTILFDHIDLDYFHQIDETVMNNFSIDSNTDVEIIDNIQKKFVPWRNMLAELNILQEKNTDINENGLIIVASLVEKLPNLGGLSRTCEVFGVKQLVISSTKYTQDRQFQNLSVSSEHWVNILEVQSGSDLKEYLLEMKNKGYRIVGAEQSSSSVMLNEYIFPKNMILLLGHEKEGISPDLLYMLDDCVEIPQQGMVRSLNVHVTASVFIWEYSRQHNFLSKKL